MKITYSVISKTGRRSNNEDSVKVMDYSEESRWLGVVCDGMGGHAMGELASETVCHAVCDYWQHSQNEDGAMLARKACRSASVKLDERSSGFNRIEMGTTLVMASIDGNVATITHCGDSRCYLIRNGNVFYQTSDHIETCFGWEVVAKCFFSYKPESAQPDTVQIELKPGDRILLCSDGLYKSMPPEILKARLMDDKSPEEILDVFDFLCEKNGDDNYTAILAIVDK
ncbi:MAG: serine/threonine-protein phosphatase [Bacteroidaceae bacterium]|nr:serine/threonine-protein phosphatase [Bacteroidaceae bacterium]